MGRQENVVTGLFQSREAANLAAEALHDVSIADGALGVMVLAPPPRGCAVASDFPEPGRRFWRTIGIGALAGGVAGAGLSVLLPGAFATFGPGVLVVGLLGGMLWGGMAGSWFGLPGSAIAAAYRDRSGEGTVEMAAVRVVSPALPSLVMARSIMADAGAISFLDESALPPKQAGVSVRAA